MCATTRSIGATGSASRRSRPRWGCGTQAAVGEQLADLDQDGWFDLPASNDCAGRDSRVFWNGLGVTGNYLDATDRAGFAGRDGTGLVTFDMDGDGDRDMAQVGQDGRSTRTSTLGAPSGATSWSVPGWRAAIATRWVPW